MYEIVRIDRSLTSPPIAASDFASTSCAVSDAFAARVATANRKKTIVA
jgi:hypothetical protein